ncbi:Hypothetical predicted protein, partial [Pelobates cultripes]
PTRSPRTRVVQPRPDTRRCLHVKEREVVYIAERFLKTFGTVATLHAAAPREARIGLHTCWDSACHLQA